MSGLEELPGRIDSLESQIVQLRTEMRDEFSAVRQEMRGSEERMLTTLRGEMRGSEERMLTTLRGEMRGSEERTLTTLRREMRGSAVTLRGEIGASEGRLREEIRTGDERVITTLSAAIDEARRHTQVLFEELLGRIAAIREGQSAAGRTRKTTGKRQKSR